MKEVDPITVRAAAALEGRSFSQTLRDGNPSLAYQIAEAVLAVATPLIEARVRSEAGERDGSASPSAGMPDLADVERRDDDG